MKFKVPLQIIELEPGNYHILVKGIFDNGDSVNWVVDTGASKSVFDKNLDDKYKNLEGENEEIHSAGVGEGPIESSLGSVNTLFFGKLKIEAFKMAILDLNKINELYSRSVPLKIGGLLGGDFLMKYNAVIDYNKRLLILKQ